MKEILDINNLKIEIAKQHKYLCIILGSELEFDET